MGVYRGLDPLKEFIANGRKAKLGAAGPPLVNADAEFEGFRREYSIAPFVHATFAPGQRVRGVIGLDGGDVVEGRLIDDRGELLTKQCPAVPRQPDRRHEGAAREDQGVRPRPGRRSM